MKQRITKQEIYKYNETLINETYFSTLKNVEKLHKVRQPTFLSLLRSFALQFFIQLEMQIKFFL